MNEYNFKINQDGNVFTLLAKDEYDYSLEVPSNISDDFSFTSPIAAIIHIYYPDLTEEIVSYLNNIPTQVDLYISTSDETKKSLIENTLASYDKGSVSVCVFENKGRDIAPTFVGFRDVFSKYEYFIHLHSKKSLIHNHLNEWRNYLFKTLLGSEKIVSTILWQLSRPDIGVVFAQHYEGIRKWLGWGPADFLNVQNLLAKSGIRIDFTNYLDFPSSTMFWGKTAAIRPLLDLNLSWNDFPTENGQDTGTIAHAIERSILFYAEYAGYKWVKIARHDLLTSYPQSILSYKNTDEYNYACNQVFVSVLKKRPEIVQGLLTNEQRVFFAKANTGEMLNHLGTGSNVLNSYVNLISGFIYKVKNIFLKSKERKQ